MLDYCQSAASATIEESAQVEARTAPYFLFVMAATDRPSTAGCSHIVQRFTVQRTNTYVHTYIHTDTACIQHVNVGLAQARPNYTCWVEIASAIDKRGLPLFIYASGKGRAQMAVINASDSTRNEA